ncbi:hypothetical protein HDU96_007680, partial [Phlyctochytrium bullatum]
DLPGTLVYSPYTTANPQPRVPIYRLPLAPSARLRVLPDLHPFSLALRCAVASFPPVRPQVRWTLEMQRERARLVARATGRRGGRRSEKSREGERMRRLLRVAAEVKDDAVFAAVVGAAIACLGARVGPPRIAPPRST